MIRGCLFTELEHLIGMAKKERSIIGQIKKPCKWFCVEVENVIVGCCCVADFGKGHARFRAMYVTKEHRGKGYSSQLNDKRFEWAEDHYFSYITSLVTDQPHRNWYKRKGFKFEKEKNGIATIRKIL